MTRKLLKMPDSIVGHSDVMNKTIVPCLNKLCPTQVAKLGIFMIAAAYPRSTYINQAIDDMDFKKLTQ